MRFAFFFALLVGCSSSNGTTDGGDAGNEGGEGGPPPTCGSITCNNKNEQCVGGTFCACAPGFATDGNSCVPVSPSSPASHTESQVCGKWKSGHVITTPKPFQAGAMSCDPGTLAQGGITDTVVRLNMFRWLVGVSDDVKDDATLNQGDQACAVIQANNSLSHMPPPNSVCYNALGAMAAGTSNLAYGQGCADSIDGYIEDPGANNVGSLGHRRWCLHPPLGIVGVGYYEAGGNKRAQCLGVFDNSGTGATPIWYAFPPPGFAPSQITQWPWSFHYSTPNVLGADTDVSVKNLATNSDAPVTVTMLGQGYGDDAISWRPKGWTPTVGEIYRVTVNPKKAAPITYDVIPVTCP